MKAFRLDSRVLPASKSIPKQKLCIRTVYVMQTRLHWMPNVIPRSGDWPLTRIRRLASTLVCSSLLSLADSRSRRWWPRLPGTAINDQTYCNRFPLWLSYANYNFSTFNGFHCTIVRFKLLSHKNISIFFADVEFYERQTRTKTETLEHRLVQCFPLTPSFVQKWNLNEEITWVRKIILNIAIKK